MHINPLDTQPMTDQSINGAEQPTPADDALGAAMIAYGQAYLRSQMRGPQLDVNLPELVAKAQMGELTREFLFTVFAEATGAPLSELRTAFAAYLTRCTNELKAQGPKLAVPTPISRRRT